MEPLTIPIYNIEIRLDISEIKSLDRQTDRQTDRQQSDLIRVLYFLKTYGTLKKSGQNDTKISTELG